MAVKENHAILKALLWHIVQKMKVLKPPLVVVPRRQELKRKLGLGKSDSVPKDLLEKEYKKQGLL